MESLLRQEFRGGDVYLVDVGTFVYALESLSGHTGEENMNISLEWNPTRMGWVLHRQSHTRTLIWH